jgi:hypothetical protein
VGDNVDDDGNGVDVVGGDDDEEEDCIGDMDGVEEGDIVGTLVSGDIDGDIVSSAEIVVTVADGRKVGGEDDDTEVCDGMPVAEPINVNPILATPSSSVISKHGVLPVVGSMTLSTPGDVNTPPPSSPVFPIQTGLKPYKFGNCALI